MSLEIEPSYISLVRGWLENDEKFLMVLKKIVDVLDKYNNQYLEDNHSYSYPGSLPSLRSVLIVQRQKPVVDLETGAVVWVNLKRQSDETGFEHDNIWCCPFPTWCKNQLYISHRTDESGKLVHLTMCKTGQDIVYGQSPLIQSGAREQIQYKDFSGVSFGQTLALSDEGHLCDEREYNVVLRVNELKDLIRSLVPSNVCKAL